LEPEDGRGLPPESSRFPVNRESRILRFMRVRIRFGKTNKLGSHARNQRLALLAGSLLTPAAVVAWVLASWRIAADLRWTNGFAISNGVFSHWQVWFAAAVLLQLCSRVLNRYGKGGNRAAS
jgi:hypothetical protein